MNTMRSCVETLLILFATCMECRGQDSVKQPKSFQSAYEEEGSVTLDCKYNTTSSNPTLLWYRQNSYDSPKYILRRHKFGDGDEASEFKGRFHSRHDSTSKSVPLTIENPRVSDSALYYCALQPTVTTGYTELEQKPT
uniref:T-cell receptor alpha/delta variable 27.0 n=1 Tax=Sinocyclocheilus anshuiensis TaxID=1608454 RepID=A0A671Q206_9TELE